MVHIDEFDFEGEQIMFFYNEVHSFAYWRVVFMNNGYFTEADFMSLCSKINLN